MLALLAKKKNIAFLSLSAFPTALVYGLTIFFISENVDGGTPTFFVVFSGLITVVEFGMPLLIARNKAAGLQLVTQMLTSWQVLSVYVGTFLMVYFATAIIVGVDNEYLRANAPAYLIFTLSGVLAGVYRGLTDRAKSFVFGLVSRYITNLSSAGAIFLCAYGVGELNALSAGCLVRLVSIPLLACLLFKHRHRWVTRPPHASIMLTMFATYAAGSLLAFTFSGVLLRYLSRIIMPEDEFIKFIYVLDVSVRLYGFIFLSLVNFLPRTQQYKANTILSISLTCVAVNLTGIFNVYSEIATIAVNGIFISLLLHYLTTNSFHKLRNAISVFEFFIFAIIGSTGMVWCGLPASRLFPVAQCLTIIGLLTYINRQRKKSDLRCIRDKY